MNITRHIEQLQNQLTASAAAGDDTTRDVADRLVTALEPAARVTILDVLTDSSAELTAALAPASIDVRLRGRDIDFIVDGIPAADVTSVGGQGSAAPASSTSPLNSPSAPTTYWSGASAESDEDNPAIAEDESTSRTTLRLPDSIKARAEKAAKAEGISLNAWLVRAISAGLEPSGSKSKRSNSISGWMR